MNKRQLLQGVATAAKGFIGLAFWLRPPSGTSEAVAATKAAEANANHESIAHKHDLEMNWELHGATRNISTVGHFETILFSAAISSVRASGYFVEEDGGGGLYKRISPPMPQRTWQRQSADGGWWELAETQPNVKMFGAKGDRKTDDHLAIQSAIDYCTSVQRAGIGALAVVLPPGGYLISRPILIISVVEGAFEYISCSLIGTAAGYINAQRTEIIPTFSDRPAIVIQRGRAIRLANFSIVGRANTGSVNYFGLLNDEASPWWNTLRARDSQYSPHCGIAIDPFSKGIPTDGGYPELGSYYELGGIAGSSAILIENIEVQRFIVGIAISLSSGTQLGDNIVIRGGDLSLNKVCVAIGQSQSRGVMIENPKVIGCQTFVDCARYGGGTGPMPTINGGIIDFVKWLFVSSSGGYGNGAINDLYCESIFSLGFYTGNGYPLHINGGEFKFVTAMGTGGAASDMHLYATCPVVVEGGSWTQYSNVKRRLSIYSSARLTFRGTVFDDTPAFSTPERVTLTDCGYRYAGAGGVYGVSDRFCESLAIIGLPRYEASLTPGGEVIDDSGRGRMVWRDVEGWLRCNLDKTVMSVSAQGIASFQAVDPGLYQVGLYLQSFTDWPIPNPLNLSINGRDLIIGCVKSVVGSTISLGEVPVSLRTGIYQIGVCSLPRIRRRCVGFIESGSDLITEVSPNNAFAAGDRIRGSGLPEGAFVESISGSRIRISTKATASGEVALYDARLRLKGYGGGPPTVGVYFDGDALENLSPGRQEDALTLAGWICVELGAPGTWEQVYLSGAARRRLEELH